MSFLRANRHTVDINILRCLTIGDTYLHKFHIDGIGVGVQGHNGFLLGVVHIKHHTAELTDSIVNNGIRIFRCVFILFTTCECQYTGYQHKGKQKNLFHNIHYSLFIVHYFTRAKYH